MRAASYGSFLYLVLQRTDLWKGLTDSVRTLTMSMVQDGLVEKMSAMSGRSEE